MSRWANRRAPGGFTLVEVLIALTLLALLMLVLTSALSSMGQVESRVEQRIEAADDYRLSTALLDDALGRVSARRFASGRVDDGPAQIPFFQAGPDALAWIGVMPARFGLGGRHYLRLALERGAAGGQLVLRYAPWDGAPTYDAWGQAQAQVLAAPVGALSLRYMDPASGRWSPVWPPPGVAAKDLPVTGLPTAVEISVDGPAPAWPPLIVALRPTYDSDPSATIGAFGGGRR
ncbi:MAG: prepilin-type N-terminal cleavage/methylation domain-containing protein [Proteobacteria bacterium]|nr:prepilin-type N-terminal cleavage/methylation domain-containing protein [Pseudomonadota bacterium]